MRDVIASEWLKLRSVRSTYALLGALVLLLAGAWAVDTAMVAAWDAAPPAEKATFDTANMAVVVVPLAQFLLAILAALVMTSEYRTGSIGLTLTAVPDRRRLLAAKAVLTGLVTAVAGGVVVLASTLLSLQAAGARPAPLKPFTSAADALAFGLSMEASLLVAALVGLGLGAVIRSSAGAVAAVTGLLFIAPVAAAYLPDPWNRRMSGVLLGTLADQLAGHAGALLAPAAAAALLCLYLVAALGAGALVLTRRDA
jgi:ABC-type transport system involved in multi-copper enzyme maturation permease subunit